MTERPSDQITKAVAGWWNADPYDAATNPGGMDEAVDGSVAGHVNSFPAAVQAVGLMTAWTGEQAAAAGAARTELDSVVAAVAGDAAAAQTAATTATAAAASVQRGVAGGVAALDETGKVPAAQMGPPQTHGHAVADVTGLQGALDGKAAADLGNVSNTDFANKASAAGIGGGSGGPLAMAGVVVVSAAYTVTPADAGKLLRCVAGLALTTTSVVTLGVGFTIGIRSETSGDVVVSAASGQTINGVAAVPLILRPGQSILLVSDGSSGWRSVGQQVIPDYTWDRGLKSTWATISADGYTGAQSGGYGYRNIRSADPVPSDRVYWEMVVTGGGMAGVAGIVLSPLVISKAVDGWGYDLNNGNVENNSVWSPYGSAVGDSDVFGVACHLAAGKIWFAKNNVWQGGGNPAAGTSPTFSNLSGNLYVAISVYSTGQIFSLRARRSQMTYAPPSGFAPLAG